MKSDLRELVRKTVQETLNALLDEKADEMVGAERYERTAAREAYRSGHYERKLITTSGEVALDAPKLRGATFQTAVIERYRRRETSVEEAIIEIYLAGVSTRRIEDVSEILWGAGVSAGTVSNLNEKAFESVDAWRTRPLSGGYPYLFVDGIYLKRSWGGSYENVAVMVAIGVNSEGRREIVGCAEGCTAFLVSLGETSQGVLYEAGLIASFCREHGLFLIVDGISSFLADPFDMDGMGADVLITDAQKALACPPGVAPMVLSPAPWRGRTRCPSRACTWTFATC